MLGEGNGAETTQRPDTCSLETRGRQSDEVEVRRRRYAALHHCTFGGSRRSLTHAISSWNPATLYPVAARTALCEGPVVWCNLI